MEMEVVNINPKEKRFFPYKGVPYEIHFQRGVYIVTLIGASGGYTILNDVITYPGKGGIAQGIIQLRSQKTLFLYIGGHGTNSTMGTPGLGGYNGGVNGANDLKDKSCASAGSGGATDLRIIGGDWNSTHGLKNRIIVAGGGGSAGCWKYAGNGGDGGGITGKKGGDSSPSDYSTETINSHLPGGNGGNQTHGGGFGYGSKGDDGAINTRGEAAGCGGGGYWGGEGGHSSCDGCSGSGGGGGSSFISGHKNCIAILENGEPSTSSIHYSGIYFVDTYTMSGVNIGNGSAYIQGLKFFSCHYQSRCITISIITIFIFICK